MDEKADRLSEPPRCPSQWATELGFEEEPGSYSSSKEQKTHTAVGLPKGFPGGAVVKNLPANAGDAGHLGLIPGTGTSLEEGMATHSSVPAWRIPWTEEPDGLWSMGSQRVSTAEHTAWAWLPEESGPQLIPFCFCGRVGTSIYNARAASQWCPPPAKKKLMCSA